MIGAASKAPADAAAAAASVVVDGCTGGTGTVLMVGAGGTIDDRGAASAVDVVAAAGLNPGGGRARCAVGKEAPDVAMCDCDEMAGAGAGSCGSTESVQQFKVRSCIVI